MALLLTSLYAPGAALAPSTVLVRSRAATMTRGQVVMRKGVGGKKLNFKNKQTKGRESGPIPWTAVNGVSIPPPGKIKAWALPLGAGGKEKILTCVNYAGDLHVFESSCTKCAWVSHGRATAQRRHLSSAANSAPPLAAACSHPRYYETSLADA